MVKCDKCGFITKKEHEFCPNCGNSLKRDESDELKCDSCGNILNPEATFCPKCGTEVKKDNVCSKCGSKVPENVVFCPKCGNKLAEEKKENICSKCGTILEDDIVFCPECGSNVETGEKFVPKVQNTSNQGFLDKINIQTLIKPLIIMVIAAVILSVIGLIIGFIWVSFIIAMVIGVGFFAGLMDTDANAVLAGLFTGLILGILEHPIVEFLFGIYGLAAYEWLFGGQILLLAIVGLFVGYVSNVYLKNDVSNFTQKHFPGLLKYFK